VRANAAQSVSSIWIFIFVPLSYARRS